jgi:hypothetical protein
MSDEEKLDRYKNVIIQNSGDIYALTEGKKTLESNRKILASQMEELRILKSSEGLARFKELKKEKMAERDALDAQAAAKAKEEADAKAKAAKVEEIKTKKKETPEKVTVQEEEIIQAATPVESFEEGVYSGEGSSKEELEEQYKDITEKANNSDVEGEVIDSSGNKIIVGDRLIAGSDKLAYASTVEYTEEGGTLKHTSIKLNPETNPNLLTDKYVPGTKLKIRKLTADEFKPFPAAKRIEFVDEVGRLRLVASKGETVTFAMLDHPYMQPIGIFNEAGEYQAMLHAVTYINSDRIVDASVETDLQTLINIRAAVTKEFQDITVNSKSNGKLNQLPMFYRLSELIDEPVEFAIATSSIQLNTSKTTPVENLANKKGFKVGQVYALTVMPDGRKMAVPVKTTRVKENPQVFTELMTALDTFLEGGKKEDLQAIFGKYLHSVFSSDKLRPDGNAFLPDPNDKDRFYIDFTSTNVEGIIFGRAGFSKNFISGNSPKDAIEGLKTALASIIQESFININFESLKDTDFVKKHVTSNVRFYPLPNGKVTVFDNPVIGFDTSNLLNATAPAAKVTTAPVSAPALDIEAEKNKIQKRQKEELNKIYPISESDPTLKDLEEVLENYGVKEEFEFITQVFKDSNVKVSFDGKHAGGLPRIASMDTGIINGKLSNILTINESTFNKLSKKEKLEVIAHEFVHGLIKLKLNEKGDLKGTSFYNGLNSIFKEVKDFYYSAERQTNKANFDFLRKNFSQKELNDLGGQIRYIESSIEEFATLGLTDSTFSKFLKLLQSKAEDSKESLWSKLSKLISDFLGISNTKFNELLNFISSELDTNINYTDEINNKYKAELNALEKTTPVVTPTPQVRSNEDIKNDIAQLRAKEQAEYDAIDPNDTAAKDKIYTEYDKLITPLINEAEADIEARKQDTLNRITLNNEDIPQAYVKDEDTFIIGDTKDIKDLKNKIDAKYKAELDAVKQVKPATTPTAQSITDTKAEIENRIVITGTDQGFEVINTSNIKKERAGTAADVRRSYSDDKYEIEFGEGDNKKTIFSDINLGQKEDSYHYFITDKKTKKRYYVVGVSSRVTGNDPDRNGSLFATIEDDGNITDFTRTVLELALIKEFENQTKKRKNIFRPLPQEFIDKVKAKEQAALGQAQQIPVVETPISNIEKLQSIKGSLRVDLGGFSIDNLSKEAYENLLHATSDPFYKDLKSWINEYKKAQKPFAVVDSSEIIVRYSEELAKLQNLKITTETPVVEPPPTPPINLTSGSGIEFDLGDLSDLDLSITTIEEIEKSVSLQDKVNTLIEEGKATKFCK